MSVASFAGKIVRKLDPFRQSNDETDQRIPIEAAWPGGPVYMPRSSEFDPWASKPDPALGQQPVDTGSMPIPNRPQRLGMPVDPTYNPPQPTFQPTDPGSELQKRAAFNVTYNPQQPANNVIQFPSSAIAPQPTMADQYMSKAVPVDELTRPRTATTGVVNAAGPATVIYGPQGQPRSAAGGADDLERQQAYLNALQSYKPENHNSRLKSILIGLGRGYLQGGLVGAVTGGVAHGVDPSLDEKYANERDIAKTSRAVAQGITYKQSQSKLADDASKRALEDAQAFKALNPTYRPTAPITTDQGIFDRNPDGSLKPLIDPTTKKPLTHATTQGNYEGKKYVPDPQNPNHRIAETWRFDAKGNPVAKVGEQSESLVDGAWISSGQATTAKATAGQRSWDQSFRQNEFSYRQNKDAQDRIDKLDADRKEQGNLTGKIDGAIQQIGMSNWKIQQLQQKQAALDKKDPNYQRLQMDYDAQISKEQENLTKARAEGAAAAQSLNTGHGQFFKAGVGEQGYPFYERKPLSLSAWRTAYPKATKQQENAWKQKREAEGFTVIE